MRRRSPLDRVLGIFGDVRAGEGIGVLLMSLNVFLLLVAYYVIKTIREPLILLAGGAELKSYASAAQALTLVAYVPLYGWVASRLSRQRFLMAVVLFFVGCLQLFSAGGQMRVPHLGFVFFVWVGVFNLTTIAQFWSYANETYSRADGDRLFPLIAVGSTVGPPVGAAIAERLFEIGASPFLMMQIAAAILLGHLALYRVMDRGPAGRPKPPQAPIGPGNGFALVLKSRYLRLIALLLVLLNVVKTLGEYVLGRAVVAAANAQAALDPGFNKEAFVGALYGRFFLWVDVGTIVIQAVVVSRIAKRFGAPGVLLALPLLAFGAYGLAATGLVAIYWVKTAENVTDYSLMNTAKQMVWLPTTREEKYNAKQAIDTFFVRAGDVLAAGLVFLGAHRLSLDVPAFIRANVLIALASILIAALVLREYKPLVETAPNP